MSPFADADESWRPCFPRVSGDEPFVDAMWAGIKRFSPRERG